MTRFTQQIQFIVELDQLKQVLRQTRLIDDSRQENSAEHSWQLAMMALVLAEYAPVPVDLQRVMTMLLLHDVVEIDAGDVFCYDVAGNVGKAEREAKAAKRLFGLLPVDLAQSFRAAWDEFEAQATPEAQFAAALDRIQPFLHNQYTAGGTWRNRRITRSQVMGRMAAVEFGTPALWPWVLEMVDKAIAAGHLVEDEA
ncbi:MAG: HD domain-containing protein [Elainellaceae cyanobacterium]